MMMGKMTSRSSGPELPAVPAEAASTPEQVSPLNTAAPASAADPVTNPAHPTSRKPNAPTGGGGTSGHGK